MLPFLVIVAVVLGALVAVAAAAAWHLVVSRRPRRALLARGSPWAQQSEPDLMIAVSQ